MVTQDFTVSIAGSNQHISKALLSCSITLPYELQFSGSSGNRPEVEEAEDVCSDLFLVTVYTCSFKI